MSLGVKAMFVVIVAIWGEFVETTALSPKLVSGTPPAAQFNGSFQSELVVPVQRLSAEYDVARLRQRTHPAIQQRFIFLSLAHKSPVFKAPLAASPSQSQGGNQAEEGQRRRRGLGYGLECKVGQPASAAHNHTEGIDNISFREACNS